MNQTLQQPVSLTAFARRQGVSAAICLSTARLFLNGPLKRFGYKNDAITRFDSDEEWVADRVEQIESYQALFRPFCSFAGKTVLEVGCNRGYMLESFLQSEAFTAIGADIDEELLQYGRQARGDRIRFIRSTTDSIPLPDAGVDAVFTIDTVEHLSKPREMFLDIHRVLRPGGMFLIHFCPWLGPYGSHLEDIIPYPWANVAFSMDTLLKVAATLYDSPEYQTACYYLDPQTGQPKPNPYLNRADWDEYLNHMTIRKFEQLLETLPFERVHFESIGFGGKTFRFARHLNRLAQVPGLNEFFSKDVFCVLKKKAT